MEEILNILGAEIPFDDKGELTDEGVAAYEKLIKILGELNRIGAIKESVDDLEKYFDEIIRLGF